MLTSFFSNFVNNWNHRNVDEIRCLKSVVIVLLLLVSIASILFLFFLFHCFPLISSLFHCSILNRNFKYKYMPLWYTKMLQIHLNWSLIRTRFHSLIDSDTAVARKAYIAMSLRASALAVVESSIYWNNVKARYFISQALSDVYILKKTLRRGRKM